MYFVTRHQIYILLSIAGATLGLLLAVLMLGMLVPRVNTLGAAMGMAAGLTAFALVRLFPRVLEMWDAARYEQLLHFVGPLAGLATNTWWDGLFTTVPAILFGIAASYCNPAPQPARLAGLLLRQRSPSSRTP